MSQSDIPQASDELIASYHLLIATAIESTPKRSAIHLARSHDNDDTIPLHQGTVFATGLLASTLDEESAAAYLTALAKIYDVPELTLAQGCVLLDFCSYVNDVMQAQLHSLPIAVYPNGALWSLIAGYPALWLAGPWQLHIGDTRLVAPNLSAAIELAAQHRRNTSR